MKRVFLTGQDTGDELINSDYSGTPENWIAKPSGMLGWQVTGFGIWTHQANTDYNEIAGLTLTNGFNIYRGYKRENKEPQIYNSLFGDTAFKSVSDLLQIGDIDVTTDSTNIKAVCVYKNLKGVSLAGSANECIFIPVLDDFSTLAPSNGIKFFIDVVELIFM